MVKCMEKKDIRIVFMGTPLIAKTVLESLIKSNYNVVLVVTNPDRFVGRKKILTPSEVKKTALENNIDVFQPLSIKKDYQRIIDVNADIIITCAYGQIIPLEVLKAPRIGCLNVHGSLLPHLRGASPIQSALFEGLEETGVTIMEMVEKMDAGKMYYKEKIKIDSEDNYTSLYEKMAKLSAETLIKMLPFYIEKTISGEEQDESEVTFCKKISAEDEHLSLDLKAEAFVNRVRGLADTPGGYLYFNDKKLKILKCKVFSHEIIKEKGQLIKVNKNELLLQLKYGLVSILEVQKESKNKMDVKTFMNGEHNLEDVKVI